MATSPIIVLRVFAVLLTGVKLTAALFLIGFGLENGVLAIIRGGPDQYSIVATGLLLGGVGVGFPFSLLRSGRLMKPGMAALSTLPLCSNIVCDELFHPGFWEECILLFLLVVLVSADIAVSNRLHAASDRFLRRPFALAAVGGVVLFCIGVVVWVGYLLVCMAGVGNALR